MPTPPSQSFAPTSNARNDLGKSDCFKLLGFLTATAAQSWFDNHIKFTYGSYGKLQVTRNAPREGTPAPAETSTYGAIYVNTDYNWGDFSKVSTSQGGIYNYLGYINGALKTNMTSDQLGTLIIIHELEHNRPQPVDAPDVGESAAEKRKIYDSCIK